ncbi:MAG TPA: LysM peptidoglycan-binding domain-containing protein [Tepidiformaceae bacterium]|nr:LysM peptidoglycan-binding domain-containing protein [Tepidiformaceae bacterium]HNO64996.1 LysM peptidoglycan-binding domain-containing protein [Tepidiformaceae bacterium]
MALVKATITNLDTGSAVTCMFNPTDYTFTKAVSWAQTTQRGANVPALEFTGGEPATVSLKLFFDTNDTGEDVRTRYTNALWDLAMVNRSKLDPKTNKGRPPRCMFAWGSAWSFEAVVTSINTNFTMFKEDGTPTRATVDLSLKQAADPGNFPAQNPTSGGVAGYKRRVVQQSETLDYIAAEEYGSSRYWREIAEANGIEDPMRVRPGTILTLPPISEV